mgnify:CR=1 FL=1
MAKIKRVLKLFVQELFGALTVAVLIFIIMELIKPDLVLAYINLSAVLVGWLISAIILVLWPHRPKL